MKNKGPLTKTWNEARKFLKEEKLEQAQDALDTGIMYLSHYSLKGIGDKELIEGVKKEVWYERFWISLENNIWPTYPDYEKNWRATS